MQAYSAGEVAEEVRRRVPGVGVLKLHKLLYYCQGYHLATFGQPLFVESISAWDHGPVVGQLWFAERQGVVDRTPSRPLGEAELNTIGYVVSRYATLSGLDLEHLTHGEPPWQEADLVRREAGRQSVPISRESMAEFFRANGSGAVGADEPELDPTDVRRLLDEAEERLQEPATVDTLDSLRSRR